MTPSPPRPPLAPPPPRSGAAASPIDETADRLAAVLALRQLADRLEDSAVERAMLEGWSWSQVAEALGVTRQAVHKKHLRRLARAGIALRRRNG